MFGGLNRLIAGTVAASAVFVVVAVAPPAALACGSGTSAVNVYKECLQTGGGGHSTGGTTGGPGATDRTGGSSRPALSSQAANALKHAGKADRRVLAGLVDGYGLSRKFPATAGDSGATGSPSALGSAFDLGSGPTALLVVLAGTALLLLGGNGMRVWRSRHSPHSP